MLVGRIELEYRTKRWNIRTGSFRVSACRCAGNSQG
jgi:hypothetical protein